MPALRPSARLEDYGIKYGYSPVLLAHPDALRQAVCLAHEEHVPPLTAAQQHMPAQQAAVLGLRPAPTHSPRPTCSTQADTVKAFLAASAEGFRYAAAHPAEAAALFVQVRPDCFMVHRLAAAEQSRTMVQELPCYEKCSAITPTGRAVCRVQAANAAHPDLAQPLEEGMCAESLQYVAPVSAAWGWALGWLGYWAADEVRRLPSLLPFMC